MAYSATRPRQKVTRPSPMPQSGWTFCPISVSGVATAEFLSRDAGPATLPFSLNVVRLACPLIAFIESTNSIYHHFDLRNRTHYARPQKVRDSDGKVLPNPGRQAKPRIVWPEFRNVRARSKPVIPMQRTLLTVPVALKFVHAAPFGTAPKIRASIPFGNCPLQQRPVHQHR